MAILNKKYYSALDIRILDILETNLKNFENDRKKGDNSFLTGSGISAFQQIITMVHNLAKAREDMARDEAIMQEVVNDYLESQVRCSGNHAYKNYKVAGETKDQEGVYTCNTYQCSICHEYFAMRIPNNFPEYVVFLEALYHEKSEQYKEIKKTDNDLKSLKQAEKILKIFEEEVSEHKRVLARYSDRKAEIEESEKQIKLMYNALTGNE